jgi:hypothetical protein
MHSKRPFKVGERSSLGGFESRYRYVDGQPNGARDPEGLQANPFDLPSEVVRNPDQGAAYVRAPSEVWAAVKQDCTAQCAFTAVVPGSVPEALFFVGEQTAPKAMSSLESLVVSRSASATANEAITVAAARTATVAATVGTVGNVVSLIGYLKCIDDCKRCAQ